jgi:hypothetical protein
LNESVIGVARFSSAELLRGLPVYDKPTRYEVRDGRF